MKLRSLNRLVLIGFLLVYFAGFGSMVSLVMPVLNDIQSPLRWYVMLPAAILGLAVIAFEKLQVPEDADHRR